MALVLDCLVLVASEANCVPCEPVRDEDVCLQGLIKKIKVETKRINTKTITMQTMFLIDETQLDAIP